MVVRHLPTSSALHRSIHSVPTSEQLLALVVDGINILAWQKSKDGQRNTNRPKSVLDSLTKPATAMRELTQTDVEDFDTWYAERFANN